MRVERRQEISMEFNGELTFRSNWLAAAIPEAAFVLLGRQPATFQIHRPTDRVPGLQKGSDQVFDAKLDSTTSTASLALQFAIFVSGY